MIRICFVCLGNICRSPTAEGVMQHLVDDGDLGHAIELDSAGTSSYHVGEKADGRARQTAKARGLALTSRSRQVTTADFARFEYLVAMDRSNQRNLLSMAPNAAGETRVHLFRDFDAGSPKGSEVPDPYYGAGDGFETVFDICEAAGRGMLEFLRKTHGL